MHDLQKMGGMAALIEAMTYIVGLVLYFTLLASARYGSLDVDPLEHVAFLVENQAIMYVWYLIIYVINAIFLVVLAVALHERLQGQSPQLAQIATAFGLIWAGLVLASGMAANVGTSMIVDLYAQEPAQAASLWLTIHFVTEALGGGNEIVGGLWVLLISTAALRSGAFPVALNYLGMVIGVAGLLTTIPFLQMLGALFGLGFIVWFAWIGLVLLRSDQKQQMA